MLNNKRYSFQKKPPPVEDEEDLPPDVPVYGTMGELTVSQSRVPIITRSSLQCGSVCSTVPPVLFLLSFNCSFYFEYSNLLWLTVLGKFNH